MNYHGHFYENQKEGSRSSAEVVAPFILGLVKPKSVIDVGCGVGTWLSVFVESGIKEYLGVEGSWVDREQLLIPESYLVAHNLEEPLRLDKKFDLAMSLEVAEHLPNTAADQFIANLTQLAPVVLFSAAIPHQGGVHHVNEQWPNYWEKKFNAHGYIAVDCIRRKVWNDARVSFWYAQNMLLYVKQTELFRYPSLASEVAVGNVGALALVHPQKYIYFAERWESVVPILGRLPAPLLQIGKKFLSLMR